jgi:predicted DNA-binding transcriptional regulator YafY
MQRSISRSAVGCSFVFRRRSPQLIEITNEDAFEQADSFGVFKGKARHRVRIHFDAFAARLVGERLWHPSQKMRPLAGGELELSMELGSLEEIERWVLSWGEHATVLEPAELKRRIRRAAEGILAAT